MDVIWRAAAAHLQQFARVCAFVCLCKDVGVWVQIYFEGVLVSDAVGQDMRDYSEPTELSVFVFSY